MGGGVSKTSNIGSEVHDKLNISINGGESKSFMSPSVDRSHEETSETISSVMGNDNEEGTLETISRVVKNDNEEGTLETISRVVENEGNDDQFVPTSSFDEDVADQLSSDDIKRNNENCESWNMLTDSLEMDNEDLLFNMLYFSNDHDEDVMNELSIGSAINNAIHETEALHSESNTPYKLKPASDFDINALQPETLDYFSIDENKKANGDESIVVNKNDELECAVCKEEFVKHVKVVILPLCNHTFHAECVLKWFTLQNWCPICRTQLSTSDSVTTESLKNKSSLISQVSRGTSNSTEVTTKKG